MREVEILHFFGEILPGGRRTGSESSSQVALLPGANGAPSNAKRPEEISPICTKATALSVLLFKVSTRVRLRPEAARDASSAIDSLWLKSVAEEALPLQTLEKSKFDQLRGGGHGKIQIPERMGRFVQTFPPCRVADQRKKEFWHKRLKESQRWEEELVTLTAEARKSFERGAERKEELMRCYEAWMRRYETRAKRREDVRRAEEEPRRAEDGEARPMKVFQRSFAKIMNKEDMLGENAMSVVDKMWHASHSNRTQRQNL